MSPIGKGILIAYFAVIALWIVTRLLRRSEPQLWCGCPRTMPWPEWAAKHDEAMVTLEAGALVRRSICRVSYRFRDVAVEFEREPS